jgi:hypothetical protein
VDKKPSPNELSRAAFDAFLSRHAGATAPGGLHAGLPIQVERLDRPGAYFLIPILDTSGLRGIVQIDADQGTVESSAAIRDPGSRFLLSADAALEAASRALPETAGWQTPYLGWRPCRESFDSFAPFWVVPHDGGRVFVTQAGAVFEALTSGKGG